MRRPRPSKRRSTSPRPCRSTSTALPGRTSSAANPDRPPRFAAGAVAGVVVVAAGLRLWGINFGLLALYRPDEDVTVGRAMGILHGVLNPHFADWPHLYFYVAAAWLAPLRLVGLVSDPASGYLGARVRLPPRPRQPFRDPRHPAEPRLCGGVVHRLPHAAVARPLAAPDQRDHPRRGDKPEVQRRPRLRGDRRGANAAGARRAPPMAAAAGTSGIDQYPRHRHPGTHVPVHRTRSRDDPAWHWLYLCAPGARDRTSDRLGATQRRAVVWHRSRARAAGGHRPCLCCMATATGRLDHPDVPARLLPVDRRRPFGLSALCRSDDSVAAAARRSGPGRIRPIDRTGSDAATGAGRGVRPDRGGAARS